VTAECRLDLSGPRKGIVVAVVRHNGELSVALARPSCL
jgi:hypothetical protein